MWRRLGLSVILLLALPAHAGAAYGATTSAVGDPPAGSPSGSIYELPLEKGRAEAAPKGSGGTAAPGANGSEDVTNGGSAPGATAGTGGAEEKETGTESGTSEEGSLYRSENNFGSSSRVPGTPQQGGDDSTSGGSGGSDSGSVQGRPAAYVADTGNTSPAANIALLGIIALIAFGSWALMRKAEAA